MQKNFLKKFIEEERYLQNQPLKTADFIEFCKKRGIETDENELEFFEKESLLYPIIRINRPIIEEERIKFMIEGKTYWKPAFQGLQKGETELKKINVKHYSPYGFNKEDRGLLLNFLEDGNLYDPSIKPFQEWSSFDSELLRNGRNRIISLYSSFQIHWLEILKKDYKISINFAGEKIRLSSNSYCKGTAISSIDNVNEFNDKYEELTDDKIFKDYFDFKIKKECLIIQYENFNKILQFLLTIQSIYTPYGRSSSKNIQIRDESWYEKRKEFDKKNELKILDITIKEIANLYSIFSKKTNELLGVRIDDWIQLWKSCAWAEKDELEGSIRFGIEYLQWSLMLKRFIEDYCEREILDIDEINISPNDILKINPSEMEQYSRQRRAIRNKYYSDPKKKKNYYHDKYKRLFYLANDFNLDYQPRIMVFVEGKSEELVLPKVFEWYYDKPENLGIEIVNFKGVDQLLSTSKSTENLRNLIDEIKSDIKDEIKNFRIDHRKRINKLIRDLKDIDIVISNWTSFIGYNLEKWQMIPFFVSDNEGNVKHFLDAEKPIKFEGKYYNVPLQWKFLWGINNDNKPFKGKDLEFANFTDKEITSAISEVINDEIDLNKVKNARKQDLGINKLHETISKPGVKINIVDKLFKNLFNEYEKSRDESILKRPIFELIERILILASLNHPPVYTYIELKNKKYISNLLNVVIKPNYCFIKL